MTTQFRNLVFEGGGVKGIAYVGTMQVLAQRGALTDIRRVGGTSAGAINALILALGFLQRLGRSPYVYNRQTLGLRLDTRKEIGLFRYDEPRRGKPIKRFTEYAKALMEALLQGQENQHLHSDDWQRTVYIDTLDVKTTDFNITRDRQQALVEQGIKGAQKYFEWFDDPRETPVNRINKGS